MFDWKWDFTWEILPRLVSATGNTLIAAGAGYAIALVLGLLLAIAQRTPYRGVTFVVRESVEFIRSTPLLLQIFFVFYVGPQFGVRLSPWTSGMIAIGVHYACYLSEVYRGRPSYAGRVFVRKDSGIESLADLRGRDIAFADPVSESGYLYPLDLFVREGLVADAGDADRFFGQTYFAGGYQQAMQAMANGLVDAAGASQYADLYLTPEQQAGIRVLGESEQIPSHAVIARPGLDAGLQGRFVDTMLRLNAAQNRYLLAYLYGPDGYVTADPKVYDGVRQMARRYGYLK